MVAAGDGAIGLELPDEFGNVVQIFVIEIAQQPGNGLALHFAHIKIAEIAEDRPSGPVWQLTLTELRPLRITLGVTPQVR